MSFEFTLFSYEWLLILRKLHIGKLCMFVFDSVAYLVPEVMKFKLCLVLWFEFRSSNVNAVSIHTLYVLAFVVFTVYFLLFLAANLQFQLCCTLSEASGENTFPASNYMFKVNNRNTRTKREICSKLTIKIPERCRSGIFIVNFEHISQLVQVFLLLTLNM